MAPSCIPFDAARAALSDTLRTWRRTVGSGNCRHSPAAVSPSQERAGAKHAPAQWRDRRLTVKAKRRREG
jgi:hypothetical protein